MPETHKVTLDDANAALHNIIAQKADIPEEPEPKPAPVPPPAPEEPPAEEPQTEEADADDVESLKQRLSNLQSEQETREKRYQENLEAIQGRYKNNEDILRDRYVRKSGVVERALGILRKARTDEGVDPSEVDRVIREIEGGMNPASANYTPEPTRMPQATEDQALILNDFLNEKRMSNTEAEEFGKWMRGEAANHLSAIEQAVAGRDLDGFLRIAHNRFIESNREADAARKRTDAAEAVKVVQKTQREAARAASSTSVAPRKQPAANRDNIDVRKLTKDDISALLRQSVDQYR